VSSFGSPQSLMIITVDTAFKNVYRATVTKNFLFGATHKQV